MKDAMKHIRKKVHAYIARHKKRRAALRTLSQEVDTLAAKQVQDTIQTTYES